MNEEFSFYFIVAFAACLIGLFAGYFFGNRSAVRQAGLAADAARVESEAQQRRIDQLEARLGYFGELVRDGFGSVRGTVDRVSREIDDAITTTSDIRATVRQIREAVKGLDDIRAISNRSIDSVNSSERATGSEIDGGE